MGERTSTETRLARIESRMVEGFMQLGADVRDRPNASVIRVDAEECTITLPSPNIPIVDIMRELDRHENADYDVICNNRLICIIAKE